MRVPSFLVLSLVACGGVNSGKSLEHPSTPEAAIGRGFDSLSGKTRGACVVPRTAPTRKGANRLIETVFYARSKEEILREVGYSGGVNFGLAGIGVNLGFETLNRDRHSASTSFAVVRIHLEARSETLQQFELEKHAVDILRRDGPRKFYEMCGDGFVAAIRQGGYFLGIIALESVSSQEARSLSGEAGVSFLGFGVRGGAHRDASNFLDRHRARYYIIQEGGDPGGATSLQRLESIDALLQRAERFKRTVVDHDQAVPTRLVVEPYQVTSNRPRRAALWDLTEQRRFLDQLAVHYGELQRAEADLKEKLASAACRGKGEQRRLENVLAGYARSVRDTRQRAEDCVNDPSRRCTNRGLDFVDADRHGRAMSLCATVPTSRDTPGMVIATPAPPPPRPGVDSPCRTWTFSTVSVQVAPNKSSGAPWDADNSPPETAFTLWLGERKITFPTQQSYTVGGAISDGLVSAGATVKASLVDRDAFFDDPIARFSNTVPPLLERGVWKLESGRTSLSFQARCIE